MQKPHRRRRRYVSIHPILHRSQPRPVCDFGFGIPRVKAAEEEEEKEKKGIVRGGGGALGVAESIPRRVYNRNS